MAKQYGYASRLTVASPAVAAEWDYDKNPSRVFPAIVATGSTQPVWWKCSECSHSYRMSPESRTIRGKGCPECEEAAAAAAAALVLKSKKNKNNNSAAVEEDDDVLPGEKNPKLKAKATGKSLMFGKR